MAVWQESAEIDAPYGKRRLGQLVNVQVPEELPRGLITTLSGLVTTVNAATGNDRVLAVAALANAARQKACRPLVLDAMEGLESGLEELLEAREDARTGRPQAWRRDLHEALILLLCRCQSYELAATDVLEFVRGDVGLCAELLTRLLAVTAYEDQIAEAATRMLFELTLPSAAIAPDAAGSKEHSLTEVATRAEATASMLLSPEGQTLLNAAVIGIGQKLRRASRILKAESHDSKQCEPIFAAVRWLCRFLLNAWSFASPITAERLRGHLRVATGILADLAIPAITIATTAIVHQSESARTHQPKGIDVELQPQQAGHCVAGALRLVAMLSYRAGGETDAAVKAALPKLCQALSFILHGDHAAQNSRVIGLALIVAINTHALNPQEGLESSAEEPTPEKKAINTARSLLAASTTKSIADGVLTHRNVAVGSLLVKGSTWLPIEKEGTAFANVLTLLQPRTDIEESPLAETAEVASAEYSEQATSVVVGSLEPEVTATEPDGEQVDGIMPASTSIAAESDLASPTASSAPMAASSVMTPSTNLGAVSTIKRQHQATAMFADTSLSGAPSLPPITSRAGRGAGSRRGLTSDAELDVATAPQHLQREWAERRWRAMQSDREGRDAARVLGHATLTQEFASASDGSAIALSGGVASSHASVKGGAAPADDGVPAAFACALDGHAMRDPVQRRGDTGGPVFERAAIFGYLAKHGNQCPVTRKPMTKSELQPCDSLRAEIQQWRTTLTRKPMTTRGSRIAVEAASSDELAASLYDF